MNKLPIGQMSALGQMQTSRDVRRMSALPPTADMCGAPVHVRFGPITDSCAAAKSIVYSMTSSANARSLSGTVNPSTLAVFMLITSSNLTGVWTGSSLGFSPLRMRSA